MGHASAAPRQVLVVEDEAIISLAIADTLEEAGYIVAGPFLSRAGALAWLRTNTPDLALLDMNLKDGSCADIARALRERNVPFIIHSGHRRRPDAPTEFAGAPWLEKPAAYDDLLGALADLTEPTD